MMRVELAIDAVGYTDRDTENRREFCMRSAPATHLDGLAMEIHPLSRRHHKGYQKERL